MPPSSANVGWTVGSGWNIGDFELAGYFGLGVGGDIL